MHLENYFEDLKQKGYTIIPDVITTEEVELAKRLFYDWQKTIPEHDKLHKNVSPHGIYKHFEAGHQEHAWFIRTHPNVVNIFKKIWNSDELIVSFDGSCFIPKEWNKKDKCWTHTDQAPNKKGLSCYQGLVSLTSNKERTLVVYEGSHLLHEDYFNSLGKCKCNKNWQLISHVFLEKIAEHKRVLNVPAGSLVLWDSRTFHQNQYGDPNSEERIVQYVSYLPKNVSSNNKKMQEKRLKYFKERRTTSHWASPINVNALQPRTYKIDYSKLEKPNLDKYMEKIMELI